MVNQLTSTEEIADLKATFRKLDLNRDGVLSRDELIKGYSEIYGDMAEAEGDKILKAADADGNGEIEYSEWLAATIDKE